jgi:2-polyprenyl-3-methyl-5-hydroxy-6-metoxy-1,4-benzoquinol methylase
MKSTIRNLIKKTGLWPTHIGVYLRKKYFNEVVKDLQSDSIKKVLDAGCGPGEYAKELALKQPNWKITAIDCIDNFCQNKLDNIVFKQIDLRQFNETEKYDFIYSIDVLEHIPENEKIIKKLIGALRKNGYLLIFMPDERDMKYIFPSILFKRYNEWRKEEHIGRMYNLSEMTVLLEKEGLDIVNSRRTWRFYGELAWELDKILRKFMPLRIILDPLIKAIASVDMRSKSGGRNILVLAKKRS